MKQGVWGFAMRAERCGERVQPSDDASEVAATAMAVHGFQRTQHNDLVYCDDQLQVSVGFGDVANDCWDDEV